MPCLLFFIPQSPEEAEEGHEEGGQDIPESPDKGEAIADRGTVHALYSYPKEHLTQSLSPFTCKEDEVKDKENSRKAHGGVYVGYPGIGPASEPVGEPHNIRDDTQYKPVQGKGRESAEKPCLDNTLLRHELYLYGS